MPHRGQRIVRQEARRFNWLAAGRRWRKTTLCMSIAIEEALRGKTIIWGAPVYDACRIGWAECLHALQGVGDKNASRLELALPNGGRILFRSLDDPDNARGHTADGVVIDEAAYCKPESWFEVLRPMLIDTGGWAWLIGSPNGRNWYWNEWLRAQDEPNSRAWRAPTRGYRIQGGDLIREPHPLENPEISEAEIRQLFGTMLQVQFQQEILAEFTEHEGQVFRFIQENLYTQTGGEDCRKHRLVMGIDWGQRADYTALSIGCADCAREIVLDRFQGIDYPTQRDRIKAHTKHWEPEVLAEANSMGLPNIEQLRVDGVPVQEFTTTHASKAQLIQAMRLAFEQRSWKWLDIRQANQELEAYEMHVTPQGNVTYGAPEGLHDDTVIARALMLHQALGGSFSVA
jgi:hypothetical protein